MLTRNDYIALYKDLAVKTTAGTGLFPSVMLAQAIVESDNGNSVLASKYNNHFGIKADSSWTGKTVDLNTTENVNGSPVSVVGTFRVYDSPEASYADRIAFLQNNPRYAAAGVFTASTPLEQLQRLQSAGYATDPNYATTLNAVLERNNLSMLDNAVAYSVAYTKQNPVIAAIIVILFFLLIYLIFKKANA